jgi:tRNA(Ile)-lysidine synthase
MAPVRSEKGHGLPLTVIRPLLSIPRSAVRGFLLEIGCSWVEDPSNEDQRFLRNRIRHHLIPVLEAHYNPRIVEGLNRLADILRGEDQWLEEWTDTELQRREVGSEPRGAAFRTRGFERLPPALRRRLARSAIQRAGGGTDRLRQAHIDAVLRLGLSKRPGGTLDLPGGVRAERTPYGLRVFRTGIERGRPPAPADPTTEDYAYRLDGPGIVSVASTGWRLRLDCFHAVEKPLKTGQFAALFDMDAVAFPIEIRNARPGDRFRPSGMIGSQKLKKFFIDHKIPRADRRKIPLLLSRGRIFWVAGIRSASFGHPTEATRRFLRAELLVV